MNYFFSIVITTFNRKDMLLKCLESLVKQQYPYIDFEVCVVDDGSSDGTSEAIKNAIFPFSYRIFSIQNGGPSNARNIGAKNVTGKFIVFLEDDVTVHPDWLKNAHEFLKTDSVDVLEGRTIYQNTMKDVRRFDNEEYFSFIPCNLFIRREIFLKTGGYDTEFNSVSENLYFRDDTELGFRLMERNLRLKKSVDVIVEHPEQFSDIARCFRHALRYQFDPLLYKKHPQKYRSSIDVKKVFGLTIHRPHHYAYIAYVIVASLFILSLVDVVHYNAVIILIPLIILAFLFRIKYQGVDALKLHKILDSVGFFFLPFVYLYGFIKGCIRYRSFGAIV